LAEQKEASMARDLIRQTVNALVVVSTVAMNGLANALPLTAS
jgi:hypothetical protein